MFGVFTATGRKNLGQFDGLVTADSARERFFDVIRTELNLVGEPVRIGVIKDMYGHPDTGWPADTTSSTSSKKTGCLAMPASITAIAVVIYCR